MKTKVKTDNRKAMPKFLITVLVAGFVGGIFGVMAGFAGHTDLPAAVVAAVYWILEAITPWAILVESVVLLGSGAVLYHQGKVMFEHWDGEDEEIIEAAEEKVSWTLVMTSLTLVLSFFFFCVNCVVAENGFVIISFILSLVFIMVLQQKSVDLTKRINPEKQGSVYDMKFHKKWIASCDENEQRLIGKAAMKSFIVTTNVCFALELVMVFLTFVLDIGILPFLIVSLILGVSQLTYSITAIRLERHR